MKTRDTTTSASPAPTDLLSFAQMFSEDLQSLFDNVGRYLLSVRIAAGGVGNKNPIVYRDDTRVASHVLETMIRF